MLGNEQTLRLERTASDNALTTTTSRIASMDGLRGFALIGMMAWHAEVSWVKGGFARMTVLRRARRSASRTLMGAVRSASAIGPNSGCVVPAG